MTVSVLRHSSHDAILIAFALVHGLLLATIPSAPLIAIALWWTANTVAHNFIHHAFFRPRAANRIFSAYLSLLLGIPQTIWRDRHLAHHAGREWRLKWSGQLGFELLVVMVLWISYAFRGADFFFGTWLLGWGGGLLLCQLQGHYEHIRGTVSHYSGLYNLLFFNDGYHVEHHARPELHWTRLPRTAGANAECSRWPAVLRWLELLNLESLERLALRSTAIRSFVLERHAAAFRRMLPLLPPVRRILVVGGALFPRTALVLRELLPESQITILDRSEQNIERARPIVDSRVRFVQASFSEEACAEMDLVIFPLAFDGVRAELYTRPPAPLVIVHDWIWRSRGEGYTVSVFLLKRLNLVRR